MFLLELIKRVLTEKVPVFKIYRFIFCQFSIILILLLIITLKITLNVTLGMIELSLLGMIFTSISRSMIQNIQIGD